MRTVASRGGARRGTEEALVRVCGGPRGLGCGVGVGTVTWSEMIAALEARKSAPVNRAAWEQPAHGDSGRRAEGTPGLIDLRKSGELRPLPPSLCKAGVVQGGV